MTTTDELQPAPSPGRTASPATMETVADAARVSIHVPDVQRGGARCRPSGHALACRRRSTSRPRVRGHPHSPASACTCARAGGPRSLNRRLRPCPTCSSATSTQATVNERRCGDITSCAGSMPTPAVSTPREQQLERCDLGRPASRQTFGSSCREPLPNHSISQLSALREARPIIPGPARPATWAKGARSQWREVQPIVTD